VGVVIISVFSISEKLYIVIVLAQVLHDMAWRRVCGFWGYGDLHPRLVVVMDSLAIVHGPRGRGDATPVLQWMLSMHVSTVFVIVFSGARVLNGDYLRLVDAAFSLGADHLLVVSMGNDVTDGATAAPIARELRRCLDRFTSAKLVYGASATVWGYSNRDYDDTVCCVCSILGCSSGARELHGARLGDSIGHLRVQSVPLCAAVVSWCSSFEPASKL